MRKILLIVLAIAMALLLCAGCNNISHTNDDDLDEELEVIVIGGASDDDPDEASDGDSNDVSDDDSNVDNDKPDGDTPDGWPIELPLYPDGEIERIVPGENDYYGIDIINTSKATMEEYAGMMINAGWECTKSDDDLMIKNFEKGDRSVMLLMYDDEESLTISLRDTPAERPLPNVWPADRLPQGFPEYPDGNIVTVYIFENGNLYITIEETSQETFDKYLTTLKDAGLSVENAGTDTIEYEGEEYPTVFWKIEKDGDSGLLYFFVPDSTARFAMN